MQINTYKKRHKIKFSKTTTDYLSTIKFGSYGLKATSSGFLTAKQLEAARRVIARTTKRIGKIIIRVYFQHPITKKPLLTRMGKGCGAIKTWVCQVKKGLILVETNNIPKTIVFNAFKLASSKLPVKVDFVTRELYKVL